ncbi:hypothetical protein BEP19_07655 [Ammoniphilus oxalaticus]|uniref:YlxR domain-containing protein n=1 Tax=Ammoniphilus oxalaticus TaxID=66863 RepID=A0A419SK08_9BACL|nr:YlxR family protein [Ammoniphilus oxalaticus]RKD24269.1 hypothetical protein BEP19_07655 [Ammoniphilus oxalaticus]
MKRRKIPLRKCVACQEMIPKQQLIRVARSPQGEVSMDPTGKAAGRGAYLCGNKDCFSLAKSRKALDRALNTAIPEEVYERLELEWIELKDPE